MLRNAHDPHGLVYTPQVSSALTSQRPSELTPTSAGNSSFFHYGRIRKPSVRTLGCPEPKGDPVSPGHSIFQHRVCLACDQPRRLCHRPLLGAGWSLGCQLNNPEIILSDSRTSRLSGGERMPCKGCFCCCLAPSGGEELSGQCSWPASLPSTPPRAAWAAHVPAPSHTDLHSDTRASIPGTGGRILKPAKQGGHDEGALKHLLRR